MIHRRVFRRSSSHNEAFLSDIPAAFGWPLAELCPSRGADAIADGENDGQAKILNVIYFTIAGSCSVKPNSRIFDQLTLIKKYS